MILAQNPKLAEGVCGASSVRHFFISWIPLRSGRTNQGRVRFTDCTEDEEGNEAMALD